MTPRPGPREMRTRTQAAEQRVLSSGGFSLHCESAGQGPVLIGLHGGPGGSGGEYLRPLHRLAGEGRRVVVFDQLGTGRSEIPPADHRWTMEEAADDVDAVRRHCGAEQVDLLGHSYGGMLALQYALQHPGRVRRLVLSSTIASTPRMVAGFLTQLLETLTVTHAVGALTADALGEHDDPLFRDAVHHWLAAWLSTGDGTVPEELLRDALDSGPAGRGLWGDRLWFATGALRGWDVEARLGEITAPTLLLNGAHDASGPDANAPIAAGLPTCTWRTLDGSHDPFESADVSTYLGIVGGFLDDRPDREGVT